MDTKKLEVFIAVAENESFTKAGALLGYTQSGVSHIIKGLEAELSLTLFSRTTRRLRLTETGRVLLASAREIVKWSEQFDQLVSGIHGIDSGNLRIASFTSISVHWLPPIIRAFKQSYPNIRIQLMEGGAQRIDQLICEGSVDLGFLSYQEQSENEFIPLANDELMAVLPRAHALAKRKACAITELANDEFIVHATGVDYDMPNALAMAGLTPKVLFSSMDDHTIISMVESGLGVSILPKLMLTGYAHNVAIRPLTPKVYRRLGISLPSLDNASPATLKFIEYTQNMLKELQ